MTTMSPFTIRPGAADEVEAVLRMKNLAWRAAPAFVWVLESNARAIAFCRKFGFTPDGTAEPLSAQWNHQRELRMVRAVTP